MRAHARRISVMGCRCTPTKLANWSGFTVISQTRPGLANVRNFPGSPGILRAHKRWGPDQLPGNDSSENGVRRAIPRASATTHAPPSRRRNALSAPARERRSGSCWPSGLARDHGISRVTAYWYLDEVIAVLASAPRTWPRRKIGDITRAALVLTHFEHSYIT